MIDSTHEADRIMAAGRQSLIEQRAGGRRNSIGEGSARLKRQHKMAKLKRIGIALAVVIVAAMGFGLFVSALGFEGLFTTVLLMVITVLLFARYPKMKSPTLETLPNGDLLQNVARTEYWLETQRPALPAPAISLVDQIGVQLDGLGVQLRGLDENTPAAVSVRNLVTRELPEVVSSYTRIPRHLRAQDSLGSTPDAQLANSLTAISREIDTVTRQLAEGDLDALAVRTRYLDYKYGEGGVDRTAALPPTGAPDTAFPDIDPTRKSLGEPNLRSADLPTKDT